jgi:pimeloyl-ACP methyl ester carboxylesterase
MKAYSVYKESRTLWLGNIPEHWDLVRPKWFFINSSVKQHPNEPLLSAAQNNGVIPREQVENRVVMPMKDLENFKLILLPEASHWVQHEESEEVNRYLIDFLLDKSSKRVMR